MTVDSPLQRHREGKTQFKWSRECFQVLNLSKSELGLCFWKSESKIGLACVHVCVSICALMLRRGDTWDSLGPRPLGEMNRLCQGHIHSWPVFQNIWKEGFFFSFSLKMSSCFPLTYFWKLLWFGKKNVAIKSAWFLTKGLQATMVG